MRVGRTLSAPARLKNPVDLTASARQRSWRRDDPGLRRLAVYLRVLDRLHTLDLTDTAVTDAGVPALAG